MPELKIGYSIVMLADLFPDSGGHTPRSLGGTPVTVMVYVPDVDAVFTRAITAGATAERAVEDQFYGDRAGQFLDPFAHKGTVALSRGRARRVAGRGPLSNAGSQLGERDREPSGRGDIDGDFVVVAADVLHEGVSGGQDNR